MPNRGKIIFRTHAIQRMFQRGVDVEDGRHILSNGEAIEEYPDDTPYPSRLIAGWIEKRPIHIVVEDNIADNETIIITVYEPESDRWSSDFRRRIL